MSTEGLVGALALLVAVATFYYTFSRRAKVSCHVGYGYLKVVPNGVEATLEIRLANNSSRPALIKGTILKVLADTAPGTVTIKSFTGFMLREKKIDGQQAPRDSTGIWLSDNESKVLEEKLMLAPSSGDIPGRGILNLELIVMTVGRKGKILYDLRVPLQATLPSSALVTKGHYLYQDDAAPKK